VLRHGNDDVATVVGSGVTVHAALAAADLLAAQGISVRVIDCYSVKPVDAETVLAAARETGLVITVEDHYPQGGLGSAVAEVLAASSVPAQLVALAVPSIPSAGPVAALTAAAGLDAPSIASVVARAVGTAPRARIRQGA